MVEESRAGRARTVAAQARTERMESILAEGYGFW